MEFEIQYTDHTLLEADGEYARASELMEKEVLSSGSVSHKKDWMIRSKITIMSPFGFCSFICHFYNSRKVFIYDYNPSSKDLHNTDLRCLTYWCNEKGWSTPEPLPYIVESWLNFWKKEWETHIIDSEYLDKRYGSRKILQFDDKIEELSEDDDI